ncbi:MAG: hypothetical protein V1790_01440 [Planctomycetota bacterium]
MSLACRLSPFCVCVFLWGAGGVSIAAPVGTAFTYQGQLRSADAPADGPHDMRFRLFDAVVGAQVGPTVCLDGVSVTNGLFAVPLDFGAQFNGDRRFLEIEARADATPGNCAGGAYTTLAPRQELQATPYAQAVRLPLVEQLDTNGSVVQFTNNGTGRVLQVTRGGAGGLSAIRADSAGDAALWGQGSTATAEGVSAISAGGAHALVAQSQGATGRAANVNITNAANPDPALFAATAGTGSAALFDGRVDVGANGFNDGELRVFHSASTDPQIRARGASSGGYVDLFDETGAFHSGFEADAAGTGGFAYIYRSTTSQGFTVDGNTGANEPRVTISGSTRSAVFDMADSGNASVELPTSAIAAAECLDEPGVASNANSDGVAIASTALAIILSRTITVPAAGYVLVLGTTQFEIFHTIGTSDRYNIGVSDSSTALPVNQDLLTMVNSAMPSGTYEKAVSPHGLFVVSAGAHTFYLLGEQSSATLAVATAFDSQLTLIYFATAYGTVTSTALSATSTAATIDPAAPGESAAPVRAGRTELEIALEREESIAANQVRLQSELSEMRVKFDALQKELEETIRAQRAAANEARGAKPIPPIREGDE